MLNRVVTTVTCIALAGMEIAATAVQPPATTAPARPPATAPTHGDGRLDRIAEIVANAVDQAHGGDKFRAHAIMQCDVALKSGENTLDGRLSIQINGHAARLDLKDGSAMVFDGQSCWVAPADSKIPAGDALKRLATWRLLASGPFIAHSPGARISAYRATMVIGLDADSYQIDWMLGGAAPAPALRGYADAHIHQLTAFGGAALPGLLGLPDGEKAVRSVVFSDFQRVEDAALATTWTLYDWNEAAGVLGNPLGTIRISNIRFTRSDEVQFASPPGARRDGGTAKP